jgi:hypothetical protein
MKETKAQRFFDRTFYEARKHVNTWGLMTDDNGEIIGFQSIFSDKYNETFSTRTVNDFEKIMRAKAKDFTIWYTHTIIDKEKFDNYMMAIQMLEATVKNSRKVLKAV